MRRVRNDDLLLFSLLDRAQDWINMYVCVFGSAEGEKRERKEVYSLCVWELEINIGYL